MISSGMPQLLVRNVSDEVVQALKTRAASHGRSVEAEHRALLEQTLAADRQARVEAWLEKSEPLRDRLKGRVFTPSEVLIRESRDER
jgi:plasmid stability protein